MALLDEERNMKIILYRLCRGLLASEKKSIMFVAFDNSQRCVLASRKTRRFFFVKTHVAEWKWWKIMSTGLLIVTRECEVQLREADQPKKQSCIRNHNQKALSRCKLPGLSIYERSRSEVVELVSQISRQLRIWQFIEHQQKFSWSNRSRQEKYWLLRCC